ncbi:Zinc ribbon domain protein [Pirellulimonas nuda]|uniref:Zinc ribbon domain protein n=1 Tax=Pirellulimonas nuda TaxID=2528009 RepID=A0A518DIU0_9BACT|nr:zinc ribbon domain-containing protein [Pirellulimonas nuda]QDU91399.1 Zinc ribbon domain protein [Pirellulimonas nuda]
MPLFDFVCRDCQAQSEQLVRPSDPDPTCPGCGSGKLMKLLSVPVAHASGGARSESGGSAMGGGGGCGGGCACHPRG